MVDIGKDSLAVSNLFYLSLQPPDGVTIFTSHFFYVTPKPASPMSTATSTATATPTNQSNSTVTVIISALSTVTSLTSKTSAASYSAPTYSPEPRRSTRKATIIGAAVGGGLGGTVILLLTALCLIVNSRKKQIRAQERARRAQELPTYQSVQELSAKPRPLTEMPGSRPISELPANCIPTELAGGAQRILELPISETFGDGALNKKPEESHGRAELSRESEQ